MPDNIPNPLPPPFAPAPPPFTPAPSGKDHVLKIVGGIAGGIIGISAVTLLPHDLGLKIFSGGVAGLLVGLIPFFIGKKRHPRLARISLWSSLIAGMILGLLLALPVAVVFACIILARKVDAMPDT